MMVSHIDLELYFVLVLDLIIVINQEYGLVYFIL